MAVSTALHLAFVVLLLFRSEVAEPDGADGEASKHSPVPQAVQMVSIAPPTKAPPPPPPPPPPPAPAPVERETPLGPDSKRPDDPPQDAAPDPRDKTVIASPEGERAPLQEAPEAPAPRRFPTAARLLSRAHGLQHLLGLTPPANQAEEILKERDSKTDGTLGDALTFGDRRLGPSFDNRPWVSSQPEAAGQCPEIPDFGTNPDGTPVLASVRGRILSRNGTVPVVGAHLQIIGTPVVTFTDAAGEYVLRFDAKSLARCRSQYVQVTHPGHRTELLLLMIGNRVRSDDVLLRRR